ncbi:PAS domain-containing protein [Amycolatopsis australiensis]|uniref:PAS domain S-box-containing protein n=1 Tax=Amycolatopsis australiensis TaxID=546364 RepID=A0A1K1SPN7_9PSEU|nr:PAS domain-containing protein [Amycolatopsis australiensis]SFW86376.1 PAS domain S-box-containing protein [Amycolatopsis australiensis]
MATHAVLVVDADGVIRQWDAGAEQLLGHPAADAVGQTLDLIVPAQLQAAHWAGFRRAMAAPKVKDLAADIPVRCADGEIRTFAGRLLALSDGLGVALGAMAIFTDAGSTGVRPFGQRNGRAQYVFDTSGAAPSLATSCVTTTLPCATSFTCKPQVPAEQRPGLFRRRRGPARTLHSSG